MKRRSRRGATLVVMCLMMGMVIIPMIGFLAFEIARAFTMHAQLRHACQAAALAGVARMASSDSLTLITTHNDTISAARDFFKANAINEYSLSSASNVSSKSHNPSGNASSVFVELLNVNNQPVNLGNIDGRIVHVVGAFGLVPVFGKFLGLGGPYTIRADANGQVPNIDLALPFDTSGSIDDQTPISAICAYWDTRGTTSGTNPTADDRVSFRLANNGTKDGNGRMYDVFNNPSAPSPTGLSVQAGPMQNLSIINGDTGAGDGNRFQFHNTLRNTNSVNGPPGNTPGTSGSTGVLVSFTPTQSSTNKYFTHLVVNTNTDSAGKAKYPMFFGSIRVDNIAEHCALAAGWLDSTTAYNTAKLALNQNPSMPIDIPVSGSNKSTYDSAIWSHLEPISSAQDAAKEFFNIMHNNTDSHFALTTINTNSPTTTTSKSDEKIASNYGIAGSHSWPEPAVALDTNNDNYNSIMTAIPTTCAGGSTNISGAIVVCRNWLKTKNRPGVDRHLIIFTDGQQTTSGDPIAESATCKTDKITVHAIGLAQNSYIVQGEVDTLNNEYPKSYTYTNENGSTATCSATKLGCAGKGLNKGLFYLVTDTQKLRWAFENLARHLVQLVKIT